MKKYILSCLFVFICATIFAAPATLPLSAEKNLRNQVAKQSQQATQEHALSIFVRKQIEQYYGKTNFKDPKHQTGWFRVADFLEWLEKNEAQLSKEPTFVMDIPKFTDQLPVQYNYTLQEIVQLSPDKRPAILMRAFWINVGVHYIAHKYGKGPNLGTISFLASPQVITAAAGKRYFQLNSSEVPEVFPVYINMGIHEGTHGLVVLDNQDNEIVDGLNGDNSLSELATFYSQYNYGLPVKIADSTIYASGVRNIVHTYEALPNFPYATEYQQFVIGALLFDQIEKKKVPTLFDDELQPDLPMWRAFLTFLAAKENHYLSIDVDENPHLRTAVSDNLLSVAQEFGFAQSDVETWLASPANAIDLGTIQWPGAQQVAEDVILWKEPGGKLFYFVGNAQRHSAQDFLKRSFGPYASNPKIMQFYKELQKALPPEILQVGKRYLPAAIIARSAGKTYAKVVEPYHKQWSQAIIQALRTVGVVPSPAIPQGYI